MFAENLFFPLRTIQCTWMTIKTRKEAARKILVYNNFPLHYIIHNSKAHKFLLSEKREILNEVKRKKICGYGCSLSLVFTRKLLLGGEEERRKNNQNCMWFVISLVFVKVTNSISAQKTGKPKKKKLKEKFLLTWFSWLCVFHAGWEQWMKTNAKSYNSTPNS